MHKEGKALLLSVLPEKIWKIAPSERSRKSSHEKIDMLLSLVWKGLRPKIKSQKSLATLHIMPSHYPQKQTRQIKSQFFCGKF